MSAAERARYRARGWAICAAVVIPFWAVAGGLAFAAVSAHAEPNEQTQLPAGGVASIERTDDAWTVTTTGPASEIKYMGPGPQQIICGTNYGDPCTTTETFTAAGDCVYLQLDGIPGENSPDPYICRGGTPSTPISTPEPATTPVSSPEPTVTPTTKPETTTPATHVPSPSPTPTGSPTSTPEPSSNPLPSQSITPSSASTGPQIRTGTLPADSARIDSAPGRLADTGFDARPLLLIVALFTVIAIAGTAFLNRDWAKR